MHAPIRTTLNLDEDALLAARHVAQRERVSLGEAVSMLVRRGASLSMGSARAEGSSPLRGRFALLPQRDEIVTTAHVRELMDREGIWHGMRALLDVDVWVALFDDAHQFSARANAFVDRPGAAIATCPLVENGVIRVMSLPGYGRRGGLPIRVVPDRSKQACRVLDHAFWPDDVTLRDDIAVDFDRVQGHRQITDLYLLALAVRHGGCLVTFDQAIALSAVRAARPEHLVLL